MVVLSSPATMTRLAITKVNGHTEECHLNSKRACTKVTLELESIREALKGRVSLFINLSFSHLLSVGSLFIASFVFLL